MTVCDKCGREAKVRVLRVEVVTALNVHPARIEPPESPAPDICDNCLGEFKFLVQDFLRKRFFHQRGD